MAVKQTGKKVYKTMQDTAHKFPNQFARYRNEFGDHITLRLYCKCEYEADRYLQL